MRIKKFGAFGAGGHARLSHFNTYEGLQLAAIYDPSTHSVQKTLKQIGRPIKVCESPQELMRTQELDAILIISPDETHPSYLEMAVGSGFPVLCEKPLATMTV